LGVHKRVFQLLYIVGGDFMVKLTVYNSENLEGKRILDIKINVSLDITGIKSQRVIKFKMFNCVMKEIFRWIRKNKTINKSESYTVLG
jgi:hypothetical protein